MEWKIVLDTITYDMREMTSYMLVKLEMFDELMTKQ